MADKKRFSTEEESWDDLGIYTSDARESMLEDDEITPFEEAFMKGYEAEFI
ncbi:MAG TPA: hypothetical protein VJI52_00640 [Candidatus Nanoarchaeia archaeon]|nr:hypothetical protein [Candidatus Nanoarchaeia archaeon]